MTAHQKLQLIRHLESALRNYGWIRHRNQLGEGANDRGMREMSRTKRIEADSNIADCQNILDHVKIMETAG